MLARESHPSARVLLAVLATALPAIVRTAPARPAPTTQRIEQAVRDLGADDFDAREKASALLWSAGRAAEELLQAAVRSTDPEVAARAGDLLEKIRLGISPASAPPIVQVLLRYGRSDKEGKARALGELGAMGREGVHALARLYGFEKDRALKQAISDQLLAEPAPAAASLVAEGDPGHAQVILDAAAERGDLRAIRALVMMALVREPPLLDRLAQRCRQDNRPAAGKLLAFIERARGDLVAARGAAEQSRDPSLIEMILLEKRDYEALAQRLQKRGGRPNDLEDPAFAESGRLLALYHLSGQREAFDDYLKAVRLRGRMSPDDALECGRAMLACGRIDDGAAMLASGGNFVEAIEALAASQRFADARQLAQRALREKSDDSAAVEVELQEMLYRLGERAPSRQRLDKLARDAVDADAELLERIVRTETRLGLADAASEHAALALSAAPSRGQAATILGALFGSESSALTWYSAIADKRPAGGIRQRLGEVADIVGGKLAPDQLQQVAQLAVDWAVEQKAPAQQPALVAIVRTLTRVGQQPIAQKLLAALVKDAPMPAASLLLGDLAAGRGDWATAAAHYEQAADREPPDALATALWALALARRGDEKQGRELFISAQQMAMGDDGGPWSLAQGLAQRGHAEQAARQQELIILTGDPRSLDYYSALETRAREWTNAGDHDRAAHAFERSLLECLGSNMHFGQIASYLHVPAAIHRLRAMASLKEGQVAAALIHADKALAINPGDVDLAIEIVTRLDALKRPVQAQALFDRVYAFLAQIVKAWPDSGQQRNNLAWLSARCLRRLDEALEHAKAAVALESDSAAYLDTLAEVHFVRGDKAQAIRWIRKAIERDPANDYLQGQLRRFGG